MPSKLSHRTRRAAGEIGERIRNARLSAAISQQGLADRIGMTRSNFARIEQGKTNVTLDTLLRIAEGLGLALTLRLVKTKLKRSVADGPKVASPASAAGRSVRRLPKRPR